VGDSVHYATEQGVATLTLDRPEDLNAIVPEPIADLEAARDRAEAAVDVRRAAAERDAPFGDYGQERR
jgi:enoyl-CoA hydratase/carnithine racemase